MVKQLSGHFRLAFPGDKFALDAEFSLPMDRVTAIFGPSGSGKTTLLRCIAGLQRSRGELFFGDACWQQGRHSLPCHRRPIAYVFQEASLFPHLSVASNLRYAQRRAAPQAPALEEVVALLDLAALMSHHPDQLSGGERQRVAIARALLIGPELLLMDEPLSGLDDRRKAEILPYLETLCRASNIPILYVSHSVDEVCRLADTLLMLENGKVSHYGPMEELLMQQVIARPGSADVSAVLRARVSRIDEQWQLAELAFNGGALWVQHNDEALGSEQRLRIRAQDVSISLSAHSDSSILNVLPCSITAISDEPVGAMQVLTLQLGSERLLARLTRRSIDHLGLTVGMSVFAQIKSVAIIR